MSRALRGGLGFLAIVVLLAGAAGCASKKIYREGTSTITGRTGDFVTVELAADPATGYSWMLVGRVDPTVVTLIETDYEPPSSSGANGRQRWTFRLVGAGSATLTFGYGRTWQNTPAEKATMFTVFVK